MLGMLGMAVADQVGTLPGSDKLYIHMQLFNAAEFAAGHV